MTSQPDPMNEPQMYVNPFLAMPVEEKPSVLKRKWNGITLEQRFERVFKELNLLEGHIDAIADDFLVEMGKTLTYDDYCLSPLYGNSIVLYDCPPLIFDHKMSLNAIRVRLAEIEGIQA